MSSVGILKFIGVEYGNLSEFTAMVRTSECNKESGSVGISFLDEAKNEIMKMMLQPYLMEKLTIVMGQGH